MCGLEPLVAGGIGVIHAMHARRTQQLEALGTSDSSRVSVDQVLDDRLGFVGQQARAVLADIAAHRIPVRAVYPGQYALGELRAIDQMHRDPSPGQAP